MVCSILCLTISITIFSYSRTYQASRHDTGLSCVVCCRYVKNRYLRPPPSTLRPPPASPSSSLPVLAQEEEEEVEREKFPWEMDGAMDSGLAINKQGKVCVCGITA